MLFYFLNKALKKMRMSAIRHSTVDKTSKIESGTSFICSSMGRYSFCGYDCSILNAEVGSFCSIASGVKIGGMAHPLHFVSTSSVFLSHKDSVKAKFGRHDYLPKIQTIIGHDVWIGEGAFIKAGVNIGIGAVVGMGAVVTKDVEPYAIVAGNPARVIKKRFNDEVAKKLLDSKWWEKNEIELSILGQYVNNPEKFIEQIL